MFCKYCGKELNDESVFCKYCGKSLSISKEEKPSIKLPSGKIIAFPVALLAIAILCFSLYRVKMGRVKNDESLSYSLNTTENGESAIADQSPFDEIEQGDYGSLLDEETEKIDKEAISDEKKDLVSDEDEKGISKATDFGEFVSGTGTVRVADDYNSYNTSDYKSGKEYYLSELIDSVDGENKTVSYATFHIHDRSIYALEIGYVDYDVEYNTLFMLSNNNGDLEIIYVVNSGMRTWVSVNEKGIVNISGEEDYGTYFDTMYAPDQSLTYQQVYNCEQYIGEGYRDYDTTYDTTNMSALDRVIIESGKNDEKARDVTYYKEDIDGKTYYYYLGGAEKITQDTVDYIDSVAEGYGFRFDGKGAADEARESYEKKLGVFEACKNSNEPDWKTDMVFDASSPGDEGEKGIIFPNSSEEIINPTDIKELSDEDLRYAINEIYARNGYIFKDEQLRNHFKQYDWYEESVKPEDFSSDMFNEVERKNIDVMKEERDSRG